MSLKGALTPQRVYDLVVSNRVAEAPNCHLREKGWKFEADAIPALMGAERVEKDKRPENPDGWVAFAHHFKGQYVRVDFDLKERDDGELILVVTMMDVSQ